MKSLNVRSKKNAQRVNVVIVLSLSFMFLFVVHLKAEAAVDYPFPQNLQQGIISNDVQLLQKILNLNVATRVSDEGAGSPGFETTYFGEKTKAAVMKFQTQYVDNPDTPGVYAYVPGAFDLLTRTIFNNYVENYKLLATSSASVAVSEPVSVDASTTTQNNLNAIYKTASPSTSTPFIDVVGPNDIKDGDTVTIYGRNFATQAPNQIRLGYNEISATSTDGVTLQVKVHSYLKDLFDKEADGLDSDDKDKVSKKMGKIPLFITIQNEKGVSNAYMIYIKMR